MPFIIDGFILLWYCISWSKQYLILGRSVMRSLIRKVRVLWRDTLVVLSFGRRERVQEAHETPSLTPRISPKTQVLSPPQRYAHKEVPIRSPVIVSKRRQKQMRTSVPDNPVPPPQEKLVIKTRDRFAPFLPIDEFLPAKCNKRCVKEILYWIRKRQVFEHSYTHVAFLKRYIYTKHFRVDEFNECFEWLEKSGLIIWHSKDVKRRLFSLCTRSDSPETQKLINAILKSFHEMNCAVRR
jgi:hypothetical protein